MVEKFRPDFLNPAINVGPLDNDKYAGGNFTDVGNLDNLPQSIKEKVPKGYVIKKYNRSDDPKELARILVLIAGAKGEEVSIMTAAKELGQRHSIVKEYFQQSLPDLVVPTQMIIGKDERTGKKTLYEIQPRLDETSTANTTIDKSLWPAYWWHVRGEEKEKIKAEKAMEDLIDYLHNTFPEQIELFKNQLRVFIEQIINFQNQTNYFPFDCAMLTNLIFTKDGLRLIDTNGIVPTRLPLRKEYDNPVERTRQMKWRNQMFNGSLEMLKIVESGL